MAPNYAKRRYCSHQLNVCLTRAFGELKSKHITSERAEHSRGWGEMQSLGLMKHQYLLFHLPHIRVPKYRGLGAVLYEQKLSLKNTRKEFPWKTVPHTNEGNWRIQCNVIVLFLNDGMKTGVGKTSLDILGQHNKYAWNRSHPFEFRYRGLSVVYTNERHGYMWNIIHVCKMFHV